MAQKRLILVSGLSGAGRSTALAALSDLGFQASDAVPTSVWPLLLQAEGVTRVAVGWPTSSAEGEEALPELPADWTLTHVFLEADEVWAKVSPLFENTCFDNIKRHFILVCCHKFDMFLLNTLV